MSALPNSLNIPRELIENVDDIVLQLGQSLDNRLSFPLKELTERYLRNDLAVGLEFSFEFGGKRSRYFALVTRNPLRERNWNLDRSRRCDNHQASVFIDDVQLVKNGEDVIRGVGGVVWLKSLDEVQDVGVLDSLYLSIKSGKYVFLGWPFFKNGKLDIPEVLFSVSDFGKKPNDMVQTGSEVVNNLTSEDTEAKRDLEVSVIRDSIKHHLRVFVGDDGVFARLKEGCNLGLKICDVLVGPF